MSSTGCRWSPLWTTCDDGVRTTRVGGPAPRTGPPTGSSCWLRTDLGGDAGGQCRVAGDRARLDRADVTRCGFAFADVLAGFLVDDQFLLPVARLDAEADARAAVQVGVAVADFQRGQQ